MVAVPLALGPEAGTNGALPLPGDVVVPVEGASRCAGMNTSPGCRGRNALNVVFFAHGPQSLRTSVLPSRCGPRKSFDLLH